MDELQASRRRYAQAIVAGAGAPDDRLMQAFAATPREDYLGPAPWAIFGGSGGTTGLVHDARLLYQDVLVAIAPERGINNGQPTLHAQCLAACAPAPGETVLHIGAGTGYYTAILAALVGPGGQVIAYEIEADLAERARSNLRHLSRVQVVAASAAEGPLPHADVIYVNAGAAYPPAAWLEALNPGARLVFPLTPEQGWGGMLLVTRRGPSSLAAAFLCRVAFIPCIGARDAERSRALADAFERQSISAVQSLRLGGLPDDTAWFVGAGWWLSTAPPR